MINLTYKDALIAENTAISTFDGTIFIGYGLMKGRALSTLKNVPETKIIEMPVAENLMVGFATGLALKGYMPVVFIERMDFLLNALDAIVNHLDKIKALSDGEFSPAVIIRCIVGNKTKPLYTGVTHVQDFSVALVNMVSFPVYCLHTPQDVISSYQKAVENFNQGISTILVEYKDLV